MASSKFEKCCAKIEHPFPNRNSDKALLPFSSAFTSFAAATFIIITLLFLTLSLITPWITLSNFIALRQFSLLIHVLQLPLALITGQWSGFFVHLTQCLPLWQLLGSVASIYLYLTITHHFFMKLLTYYYPAFQDKQNDIRSFFRQYTMVICIVYLPLLTNMSPIAALAHQLLLTPVIFVPLLGIAAYTFQHHHYHYLQWNPSPLKSSSLEEGLKPSDRHIYEKDKLPPLTHRLLDEHHERPPSVLSEESNPPLTSQALENHNILFSPPPSESDEDSYSETNSDDSNISWKTALGDEQAK